MTAQDRPHHPTELDELDDSSVPACAPSRHRGRCASDIDDLRVIDDWPRPTPVASREIVVIETYLAGMLDELLGGKSR